MLIVAIMLVIDGVVLTAWQIVDPLQRKTSNLPLQVTRKSRAHTMFNILLPTKINFDMAQLQRCAKLLENRTHHMLFVGE